MHIKLVQNRNIISHIVTEHHLETAISEHHIQNDSCYQNFFETEEIQHKILKTRVKPRGVCQFFKP